MIYWKCHTINHNKKKEVQEHKPASNVIFRSQPGTYARIVNFQFAIQEIAENHAIDAFKQELFFALDVLTFAKYVGFGFVKDVSVNVFLFKILMIKSKFLNFILTQKY
jgi:hypothetical protein